MTYPVAGAGSPKTEILIDGAWVDYSSRVRAESEITITRGRADEQGRLAAQTANFVLNNRDGLFSNRNPLSPLHRKIPQNTQIRFTAGSGDTFLRYPSDFAEDGANRTATPDTAALDVVGDIEIRLEVHPYSWRPRATQILFSKYKLTGDQRSWALYMDALGRLTFTWSTDGTSAGRVTVICGNAIPATTGKLAIKVTLDVVNGANKTIEFWTAPTIDGTYTLLASSTLAGNTSIYASTANLVIGQGDDSPIIFGTADPLRGRVFAARVYNGIAGTVRANPDFTIQAIGSTSLVDSTGLTWTHGGTTRITSNRLRFWGELTSLPQGWDKSGRDVWVDCVASGLIRRLVQGASPLSSPIYRAISPRDLTGYWPIEDGSQSTSAASDVDGVRAGTVTRVQFADVLTLPGSKSAASFIDGTGRFIGVPKSTVATGTAYFTFYFYLPSLPVTQSRYVRLTTSGAARTIFISVSPTTFVFDFLAADGSTLSSSAVLFGGADMIPTGRWMTMNLLMTASGGNVSWTARWSNVAAETFVGSVPLLFAGTVGRFVNVDISAAGSTAFVDSSFAHVQTSTADLDFVNDDLAKASNAYLGETAANRLIRLGAEENVAMEISGDATVSEAMGYQGVETFIDLAYECADVDRGMLGESRDKLSLTYRVRADLENGYDLPLNYGAEELAEVPRSVEDDYGVTNDVVVRRPSGSSGRREITTGYMSVLDPPNGIGRYATETTINLEDDSRLVDTASWIANTSTWDGARYPNVTVAIHRSQVYSNGPLLYRAISADLGDTLVLTSMPAWTPPDDVLSLIQGYTEMLGKFLWTIVHNTSPAGTYSIGRYDYDTVAGRSRFDHATSTLSVGINSTTTTIILDANSSTPSVADVWTSNAASYPFDIIIGGERMTLTQAPTGSTSPQTFNNVTRSVNGVVKSHLAGPRARLFRPVFYQL